MPRSEAVVDLAAIRGNVARLRSSTSAQVMAVVKADGYGHGQLESARAALAGGASWLGVALLAEALALRAAGVTEPVLAWLWTPQESVALGQAIAHGVDIGISSPAALHAVQVAAQAVGTAARIHLKIDTGLSRNGVDVGDWPAVIAETARAQAAGVIRAVGVWSHFACADEPGHPSIDRQLEHFRAALEVAARAGVHPELRHLANSAATLTRPDTHFDLVRSGIAIYGLSPIPALGDFGLWPAMTLRAELANVKTVPGGVGVSYGHSYVTKSRTTLALVALGYADGVPRAAGNIAPVLINGRRFTISGRVSMDQFVVDVGDIAAQAGDSAVLFGPGRDGEPLAQDWADVLGTLHYEIVTRIGARVPRRYVGAQAQTGAAS